MERLALGSARRGPALPVNPPLDSCPFGADTLQRQVLHFSCAPPPHRARDHRGRDRDMRTNVPLKAFIVGAVAVAFIVPLAMILGVVKDRARYRDTVTAEVARSTAQSQTLVGPLVVVRYREVLPAAVKGGVEQVREGVDVLLPD